MVTTTLPAVVRVVDLPVGTTVTGAELFEAVQTTAGVGVSVQLSLNQVFTSLGGLPTGGATGTILNKSSGSNYSTQFSAINTFVNVGTSLATTGSATSIVAFVANQGITSTQILNNTITSTQIANNAVGTNQVASSLGIASSLSVGGLLTVGGTATITGTTIINGGLQVTGTSQFTGSFSVAGTSVVTGSLGVIGTALFTSGAFGVVGTSLFTGSHGVAGTALFTSGAFGVVGTSNITGNFSAYPTSNLGFDVNYNTGTFLSPSAGDHIRLIGANGIQAAIVAQGFGQNSILILSSSNGTLQAPTTVGADAIVGSIRSFPYNGSSYNVGVGFQLLTLNAQSTTDASGYIKVLVAATGTVSPFESVRFQASGGVSIGTSHDPGIGRLEVNSGILVNGGTTLFTTAFGVVGTSIMTGVHSVVGTTLFTSGTFGVVGTSLLTGAFGVVGTASFTGVHGVVGTTLFTSGAFGVVGTSNFTGTFILGSQGAGLLAVSATGVVTATTVAAGSFVLLNTLSPNNVASTNDTSSFSSTYKTYMITFENICPSTQTTFFQMTVATSGSAFISGGYLSMVMASAGGTTAVQYSTTVLQISGSAAGYSLPTTLAYGLSGFIKLFNPSSTVSRKNIVGQASYIAVGVVGTPIMIGADICGLYDGASSPVTGINFLFSSGNIQTGTIKIYGMT